MLFNSASDWETCRHLLPPLASSLAYSNYSSWRQQQPEGVDLPPVVEGELSLEQLYKASEREVNTPVGQA